MMFVVEYFNDTAVVRIKTYVDSIDFFFSADSTTFFKISHNYTYLARRIQTDFCFLVYSIELLSSSHPLEVQRQLLSVLIICGSLRFLFSNKIMIFEISDQ